MHIPLYTEDHGMHHGCWLPCCGAPCGTQPPAILFFARRCYRAEHPTSHACVGWKARAPSSAPLFPLPCGHAVRRIKDVTVWLSSSSTVGSGTACGTGISATYSGQVLNTTCPSVANAQYVTVQRFVAGGGKEYLGIMEMWVLQTATGKCVRERQCLGLSRAEQRVPVHIILPRTAIPYDQ